MPDIDFASYLRAPRINATNGVVLSIRVLLAAPKDASPQEVEALEEVRDTATTVQYAISERHRSRGANLRPLDRRFDGSWAGFYGRMLAWTRMYDHPQAQRASELLASLFPTGLQFVTFGYDAQWFHSRMLLERFKQEDLLEDLVALAGEPFVTGVQAAHAALGEALGLDESGQASNSAPSIGSQVAALAEALGDYGRILSGGVNKKDPASCARFLAAVAPIDAFRARSRRSAGEGGDVNEELDADELEDDDVDFDSPLPPVPGGDGG